MLIKIDDSIKEYIIQNSSNLNRFSQEIISLNSIARAYLNMKHLVTSSLETLEFLGECELLDQTSREIFLYLTSKFYYLGDLEERFSYKVIAHKLQFDFKRDRNDFWIAINRLHDLSETKLISENLTDCYFYVNLCKKIISENKRFNDQNINFHAVHCGGSDAYNTTLNELNRENFVLLILDSDQNYKYDNVGTSLQSARRIFSEKKNSNIINLYEPKVREKENLIPPSFYLLQEKPPRKELLEYLEALQGDDKRFEILRYLDIKDGLTAKKCKTTDKEWHLLYDSVLTELSAKGQLACSFEEIISKEDDYPVFHGIGNRAVEIFQDEVLCGGLLKKKEKKDSLIKNGLRIPKRVIDRLEEKIELSRKLIDSLPEYIRQDWIDLSNEIMSWGCCASETEVIFYY